MDGDLILGFTIFAIVLFGAYKLGYYRGKANVRHYR